MKLEVMDILRLISPGTPIREGLENILKAKTGALIVVGYGKDVAEMTDGGFEINAEYNPSRLYELAKMDGAMILSDDFKKILIANAELIPNSKIESSETGTRHRTAERVAKQTGHMVISISQRRGIITIFKDDWKYVLEDTARVAARANQALQTVEKYRNVVDSRINVLDQYELNDIATLQLVVDTIQRMELLRKISEEVQKSIYELGTEGRLIQKQLDELTYGIDQEELLVIRDYATNGKEPEAVFNEIKELEHDDLLEDTIISKALGMKETDNFEAVAVYSRGYRILRKIPRMPQTIVENVVDKFSSLQDILNADELTLNEVEGVGEKRARTIKQSLKHMEEQFVFNQDIYNY